MKLTRAEEQIMQVLWDLEEAFVREILDRLEDPRPAYNTVSTIVRILEKKGFVGHHAYGKSHKYYPLVSREEYTRTTMKDFVKNYFGNSFERMVSFFARGKDIDLKEMEDIMRIMQEEIEKQQKNG